MLIYDISQCFSNLVTAKTVPTIYPVVNGNIYIAERKAQNVTCAAYGARGEDIRYLQWYKEINGNLYPVDESKVIAAKEQTKDFQYIESSTLVFDNFSSSDEGKYVCRRQIGSRKPTQESVQVLLSKP